MKVIVFGFGLESVKEGIGREKWIEGDRDFWILDIVLKVMLSFWRV